MAEISLPQGDATELYSSLPFNPISKCIRVLEVEAPNPHEADGGCIRGELRVVDLNDPEAPPFTALTYTWGDKAEIPDSIVCGGRSIEVTKNCHTALLHLRRRLGAFRIWVDAICINQHATHEKMEQITLMGEIYSFAETVYVWLGEGSPETRRATQYLQSCGFQDHFRGDGEAKLRSGSWSAIRACFWDKLSPSRHPFPFDKPAQGWISRCLSRNAPYALYSDINALLDVEWIRRMWTYQEIILAANPIVVRGDDFVPWERLAMGIIFLEFSGVHHQKLFNNGRPRIPVLETWAKVALCRDQLYQRSLRKPLEPSSDADSNVSSETPEKSPSARSLSSYQKFTLKFSQNLGHAKDAIAGFSSFAICTFLISGFIFGLFVMIKNIIAPKKWATPDKSKVEQIANASTLLAACGKACLQNMTAETCNHVCATAKDAQDNMPDLTFQTYGTYAPRTALWPNLSLWSTCVLVVLASILGLLLHEKVFANLRPVLHPEGSKIDLASAICSRGAVEQRDKAFALQAILQRLMDQKLPVPENARSLEEIFEELTVRIVEATDSLQFLVAAALHNLPGKSSWIPDWSAQYDQYWIQPPLVYGEPQNATPGSKSYWRTISTNDSLIVVRGMWQSRLARVVQFEDKSKLPTTEQEGVEIRNIQKLFDLCGSCQSKNALRLRTFDIVARTRELAVLPSLSNRENKALGILLAVLHGERLEESALIAQREQRSNSLFRYFLSAGKSKEFRTLVWDNVHFYWWHLFLPKEAIRILWLSLRCSLGDVLDTSTKICDRLARRRKAVFTVRGYVSESSTDRRWDEYLKTEEQNKGQSHIASTEEDDTLDNQTATKKIGVCEYSAQVGDDVVLISGVRTPLIVRRGEHSTKLVSPAFVNGTSKGQSWHQNWEKGDLDEFFIS